ncbi:uncharacterized protein [Nicotiana sylvestris]|uniref:Transcriptional regulator ATRX homolog n=2 Tax=Nicotiana TaxID=4085 RepID=A0A1S4D604_TOBAC|nr:PREDICTED: transcriptional regulator ATRX homolog [Nicotiana sylvestris]XP_009795871.1 PREDICTED: transcriptional regulator ATRX homolog [Nicotiana sylvestris]XP_009795872.1 PREDICTED: transcriptional regulator ATRX homolog [Nicotiana sylvestris]XP_016508859.1 PREDICTED: transcriptional regulator ATRX homolog [Nicotiana tabacum]XP_016508860.1 PREDICTED: transcriptional regulator ATRX homolog [Nicotiana tabacum]XP_016508861.1 PREDICTED: transcriptional regulator ATRX homolog [Nicotiana tabac
MGSRKSSSKKKSSKKKRPKISSKIRKRKSRRNKSKKFSSSEDDTSSSASSDYSSSPQSLSSSSEDDYSRKSRRHSRDVKHLKKRTRRRSSSRDVNGGSPLVKKRKRSNRKGLDYGRKVQKKKRRRHASISSKSSDSRSCSSCRCENSISSRGSDCTSGSKDIDQKSPRIKSRKGMKEKRICNEPSIEKRSGSRGPSCSSCNHQSCSCNTTHSGTGYVEEKNPKRLRSVIIVPEKTYEKEGDEQGTDMLKEESLNKHHGCPSCRNHDNNDLESKRKLASCSCFSSNQTMQVENLIIVDAVPPNSETIGPTKVGGIIDPHPNKVKEVSHNNGGEGGVSDSNANSGFEDLETLLRKKALENLQKFRKELQTNLKSGAKEKKNDSDVNRLSPPKTEVLPYKYLEQENKEGLALNQVIGCRNKLVTNEEFPHSTKIEINTAVEENNGKRTGYIKESITQPADRSALSRSPEKEDHTAAPVHIDESEPGKPSCITTVQTYKREDSLASQRNINKTPDPLRPGVLSTGTSDNLGIGAVNTSIRPNVETTSGVRSTSEGLTSKHQPDAKDGSQFEQKTMSVMRGGEMVQVNYKVYIPKRAPALARRQLKR